MSRYQPIAWTPEAIERVAGMMRSGYSASQIGRAIGKSRQSVVGIASRDKGLAAIGFKTRKKSVATANGKPVQIPSIDYLPDAPEPLMRVLLDLGTGCKWPIGDPKEPGFGFCGHERHEGSLSYCEFHERKSRAAP